MSLSNYLVQYITYPFWMLRDRRFGLYRYMYGYRKYNSLSFNEIYVRQIKNLEKLLKHAYQHTRYYHWLFDKNGVTYEDLSDPLTVLKELPILKKDDIRQNEKIILADNFPMHQVLKDSTGGSTGTPLTIYRDKECIIKRKAQELFFDKWIGYKPGDKVAFFVAASHYPKGFKGFRSRLRNATSRRLLAFNPYRTDDEYMEKYLRMLRIFRPDIIKCFPNSLYIFANFLKKKGIDDIKVKAVSCTGETLHDYQRRLFQELFKCPVYEKYGSFEIGVSACECSEHNGMHMFPDGVLFEFLNSEDKEADPGEMAKLIVTDLFNYGFPLVRYQIGDVGIYSKKSCPCGSPLPIMAKLYGRDRDILVDQNGRPKTGYLFVEVFNKNNIPGQFQVIQENKRKVSIKVVKKEGYAPFHEKLILKKFEVLLGSSMEIKISYVNNIPRDPSGKYKYVHSMVSPFT